MANQALQVFKKETREMFRDKRVRSSAILGPFLLVFVMMMSFGSLIDKVTKPHAVKIHVVNPQPDNPVLHVDKESPLQIVPIKSIDEGRELIGSGKAALVLNFPDNFVSDLAAGKPVSIQAIYDSKEQRSQLAESSFEKLIGRFNQVSVKALLTSKGISPDLATQVKLKSEDATRNKGANEILLAILPYLIVFWAFIGGVSAASDLVAGEKERNTLETLLISPVPRTKIVWGKFLSLCCLCLMSSLSGLAAVYVAAASHLPGMDTMFHEGTGLGPATVGSVILVLLPTVAFFASVLIAISTFARNTREAQTYLSLASILVSFPALSSQFIGFSDMATAKWINLIPVMNASAAVRSALLGKLDSTSLALTAGTSAVLAVISIVIAIRLFNRENVLLRV